jgi:hypothetical protein
VVTARAQTLIYGTYICIYDRNCIYDNPVYVRQIIIVANPRIYNWPEDPVVVEEESSGRITTASPLFMVVSTVLAVLLARF